MKENQGPKQVMRSSLECPRPKGGKMVNDVTGSYRKDNYHIKIDHIRGDQEARVSAVL